MRQMYQIIAIGGGGFSNAEDPTLDDFCLLGLPDRPKLGFIGAASGDDPVKIERFYARFSGRAGSLSHLPLSAISRDAEDWVDGLDLIYVGGGNTAHLIAYLRATGIAAVLARATAKGTVLAGVSAGAACWFDHVLTDSLGDGLRPLAGLGIVPGSCCPHFSTQPERQPAFREAIADGVLPSGLAIDDGVAVRLSSAAAESLCSARPGAGAYRIARDGKGVAQQALPGSG